MPQFDSKIFNPEAFRRYVDRIPNTKRNELVNSRAIIIDNEFTSVLPEQTGGNYVTIPFLGKIGRSTKNYDGKTDITSNSSETYSQGVVVVGRADSWTEKDFSYSISGVDFMDNVALQVAEYWSEVDQDTLLYILEGIFSMTGNNFVSTHTYDISGRSGDAAKFNETTLNTAIQKASGDNKGAFALAIMHSQIATNLENLSLLSYLKYTDANGVQRDLSLATLNGRVVLIDDSMPYDSSAGTYITYVLGEGAFRISDAGVKVPYEMSRDAATNGGEDTLYSRQRKAFIPYGISFTKTSMAALSPTDAELKNGANWDVVNNGKTDNDKKYIDLKAIHIARIITKEENGSI